MSDIELYLKRLNGEIPFLPRGFWSSITIRQVIKYLLEGYLKYDRDQIVQNFSVAFLKQYKLEGIMKRFNGSPYNILNHVYPNEFKPWELSNAPVNTWTIDTAIEATKWLFEEKLNWNEEEIKLYATRRCFISNGLAGLMKCYTSVYELLELAYPGKYKEEELRHRTKK